eukprot:7381930-Prymnesium_polylepis.1
MNTLRGEAAATGRVGDGGGGEGFKIAARASGLRGRRQGNAAADAGEGGGSTRGQQRRHHRAGVPVRRDAQRPQPAGRPGHGGGYNGFILGGGAARLGGPRHATAAERADGALSRGRRSRMPSPAALPCGR